MRPALSDDAEWLARAQLLLDTASVTGSAAAPATDSDPALRAALRNLVEEAKFDLTEFITSDFVNFFLHGRASKPKSTNHVRKRKPATNTNITTNITTNNTTNTTANTRRGRRTPVESTRVVKDVGPLSRHHPSTRSGRRHHRDGEDKNSHPLTHHRDKAWKFECDCCQHCVRYRAEFNRHVALGVGRQGFKIVRANPPQEMVWYGVDEEGAVYTGNIVYDENSQGNDKAGSSKTPGQCGERIRALARQRK
ncbi:hypothetical protein HRR83_000683 [Exophiala dermatitidis]|uniref:Uncharacterized protein n=1 Tax=Exophiala dermatitidis TaxID=5970 RepID=A0AAN6F3A8_EXODE|nr:hypothetical protein HRR74_000686 [Exophiala dermatitidis]KAJ4528565.1 hypothetical protein HRR73_001188 [Exophiala dermatitidis]KAJ4529937.1 hypothetical protein HRR76_009184 [Exophiala dermatitidis]KAJ4558698.1 hypothetical protein HRR77_000684 [Exophiala dermatitidis]KAJ4581271.1 hypothetical protein HRR79_000314 [Exophiala dermatitidis]